MKEQGNIIIFLLLIGIFITCIVFGVYIWLLKKRGRKMTGKYGLKIKENEMFVDVPLVIDDVKDLKTFAMSRCSYFSIQCDKPSTEWVLEMRERRIPFLMVALSGIIYQPIGGGLFDGPEKFEELFKVVEENPEVYVDTNDVWLPNFVLDQKNLRSGNVYRVGLKLFKAAYGFRNQEFSKKDFVTSLERFSGEIHYSPEETEALGLWEEEQIKEARAHYREHPELSLRERFEKKGGK